MKEVQDGSNKKLIEEDKQKVNKEKEEEEYKCESL